MAKMDLYANQACITTVESATGTLTFQKLETGISIGARQAWVIHRLEYFFSTYTLINSSGDLMTAGLSQSNTWTSALLSEPTLLDMIQIERVDSGTAATAHIYNRPLLKDFASLPNGGLLIVPNPLYGFTVGSGLTGPITVRLRLYYTQIEIGDSEFYDLWQSRVMLT